MTAPLHAFARARWSTATALAAALALSACHRDARPTPSPAQLQAQRLAEQQAAQRLEAERRRLAEARLAQRRQRLAEEFAALEQQHAAALAVLLRWHGAGDGRVELLGQMLARLPLLAGLQPMVEACGARLHELADHPQGPGTPAELAGRVRSQCDLAMRAQAIAQRQMLAQLKVFLALPPWYRDIGVRYAQQGKVSWHQWLELLTLERDYELRAAPLRAAAAAVDLALPTAEHLAPGLQARATVIAQMRALEAKLGLPAGVDDPRFAAQVRAAWPAAAALGPLAGWRQPPLQVRALDPLWQPLVDAQGRPTRRIREFAALVAVPTGGTAPAPASIPAWAHGCWVLWGALEQQGGRTVLRWGDDLRRSRCPGAAKAGPVVAQGEPQAGAASP